MNEQVAADLFDVPTREIVAFDVEDPFNDDNRLEGFLCRRGDHRYGALVISRVNGLEAVQGPILCTPKLHYPFSTDDITGERKYHWGKISRALIYDKWDGTNICAYSYADSTGQEFVTFKTRLTPVVMSSESFGDFRSMWSEMLVKYPALACPYLVETGHYSFSFEMYGYRNPILIEYETPLDAVLLFAVRQSDGAVLPASKLCDQHDFPVAQVVGNVGNPDDLTRVYNEMRDKAQKANEQKDDGRITGCEGFVFYADDVENGWKMYKVKPDMIESIHWANDSISPNSVLTTCWNALENVDVEDLTIMFVSELLAEEYSDIQIAKSVFRIEKSIKTVQAAVAFRAKVRDAIAGLPADLTEMDMENRKGDIMRVMSKSFERGEMRIVFTAIRELGY